MSSGCWKTRATTALEEPRKGSTHRAWLSRIHIHVVVGACGIARIREVIGVEAPLRRAAPVRQRAIQNPISRHLEAVLEIPALAGEMSPAQACRQPMRPAARNLIRRPHV